MTTLREAAQQALEALQAYGSHAPNCDYLVLLTSLPPQRKPCSCGLGANITTLRAALAEPVKAGMTRDDIIRMAQEADDLTDAELGSEWNPDRENLRDIHFAALVAAAEREACAMVAEERTTAWTEYDYNSACMDCAKAIRARGQT